MSEQVRAFGNQIKILVIENDCARLVKLMLWLDQNNAFENRGMLEGKINFMEQIRIYQPDLVLLNSRMLTAERAAILTSWSGNWEAPSLVLLSQDDDVTREHQAVAGCDGYVQSTSNLADLGEAINKAINKRRLAVAVANVPLTRAG